MSENSKIIDVNYIAELAKIEIDPSEKEVFQKDMENIVTYVNQLSELDIEGVEPTAHTVKMENIWREDKAENSFAREVMLSNAPDTIDEELIRVPQVLPGEGTA